jgi:hypothetical protein
VVVLGKRKMHGNGLGAGAHLQLHAVVLQQQSELLFVVLGVEVGPRQGGFVAAGTGHKTVAQARVVLGAAAHHGVGVDAHKGVAGAHMAGQVFTGHKALHGVAQMGDLLVIDQPGLGQCGGGIGETCGGDEGGLVGHACIVQCLTLVRVLWGCKVKSYRPCSRCLTLRRVHPAYN